eukprot:TRINITY_DN7042_c0_g1_i2.p1 TRINITY_DN7042_c0_g1~~TRINITY_DN7042_c0_g1_i2.p1  ORF type:complete len:646 (+),score=142.20 TRINITY_DN7042_c0_g1_i2:62-1939(+)
MSETENVEEAIQGGCFVISDLSCVPNIRDALDQAFQEKFDCISVPLVHPRFRRNLVSGKDRDMPFTRSDLELNSSVWSTQVVGRISPWINLDSPSESVRKNSELAFKQEMAWASHLSVFAIVLPSASSRNCANLARCINQTVLQMQYAQLWLPVPLISKQQQLKQENGEDDQKDVAQDPWEIWNQIRFMCEHHPRLGVALEITSDLPSNEEQLRWYGESVRAVVLPTSIFLTNRRGFPVLSRPHQQFLAGLFKRQVRVMIRGKSKHVNGLTHYVEYVRYLASVSTRQDPQEEFESPFYDYLQAPLQPLMDNLESSTYETFERDPVKYVQYEKAVYKALCDRAAPDSTTVIMVVGAGRGPLVRASLKAAHTAKRQVRVYAVEKNPNAVVTLRNLKNSIWGDRVTVVSHDMRTWQAPEPADILVSELLGSFGDNELSPECLDGAQRFLKEGGISIPCEYTSFLAPITTPKLWNDVNNYGGLKHFETPYVVRLYNFFQMAPAQPCFTFVHPIPNVADKTRNQRYISLKFRPSLGSAMHGLAGYFDAKLYDDVHISINPETFSEGMFSWFPIYFPIRNPMYVAAGDEVEVQMWRCVSESSGKVWYEWSITSPSSITIHNPNGRSYWIGL